ncbi:11030_t:CDS:2, partial [Ambispora gerdemannii]
KNRKKKVAGNFTNAEDLKNRFFAEIEERRKAEDCNNLATFFNAAASVADDVGEIKLSANEAIFNQKKQALISKVQELINQCQTSSNTFSKKLQRQLGEVQKLEPKHQKELLQLEQEAKELESAYNENVKKANDPNTSPEDKTKFLLLASQISEKAKRLKQRISQNPLADLSRFSNLDDLKTLIDGKIPRNPGSSKPKGNPKTGNSGGGSTPIPNPLEDPESFFEQYKTQIFIAMALIGIIFFLYSQKDTEEDEDTKEDKKFMRQMMLMKAMNSSNKVNEE